MSATPEIILENESLIAIDKPPGMLSVPDRYRDERFSIATWITGTHPTARPLHRIDFETSGVLLFCILPEAFGFYSDQFEKRDVIKTYHAILEGRMREEGGLIDQPLYTQSNGKVIISKRGKSSQTKWRLLENFQQYAFVEANPLTGRTHQIRVHFASAGHPLVGDLNYGSSGPLFLSAIKGKKHYRQGKDAEPERPLLSRTALHAARLELKGFHSGENIVIESPLPKDMRVSLQKLKQYAALHK